MRAGALRSLLRVAPAPMRWTSTALLLIPSWVGFIVFPAVGQPLPGLLVALGGYIVLFGGGMTLWPRLRACAIAVVGLLLCAGIGMLVGRSPLLTLAAYLVTAVVFALIADWVTPGPPGPYFFVLLVGAGTLLGSAKLPLLPALGWLAAGTALGLIAVLADAVMHRSDPVQRPQPRPEIAPWWITLLRVGLAIAVTTVISILRGDAHPFWAVLVVVLVLSYPGDTGRLALRAASRLLGTLIGVALFLPFAGLHLGTAGYIAAICILLWFVARWAARNYLIGSVLITVLALLMTVPLDPGQTPQQIAVDRGVDTVIAGVVAIAMLLLVRPRSVRS